MEQKERKKRCPGMFVHIQAIKEIKNEINKVVTKMGEYQEKLTEELKKSSEKSQVQILKSQIKDLELEIRSLMNEKKALSDEKSTVFQDLSAVRETLSSEKKKISFSSIQDLEKREEEINFKLMTHKVTAQQEREISNQLTEIKKKKIEMSGLGSKENKLQLLSQRAQELKEAVNDLKGKIQEKKISLEELNSQLKSLSEKGRVKPPLVLDYENKINDLKNQKDILYEKKKKEQEEITKKEELWEKHQEELQKIIEIENQKKAIKLKIKKYNEDRNTLVSEQENFNPEKYDEIRIALGNLPKSKNVCLPIPLIQRILKAGFSIPKSQEDINSLISVISSSKKDFVKLSDEKIQKIEEKIAALDLKINEEKKVLDEMPETDFKLKKELLFQN